MKHPFKVDDIELLYEKTRSGLRIYADKKAIDDLSEKYNLGFYDWQAIAEQYSLPIEPLQICFKIIRSNRVDLDRIELHPVAKGDYGISISEGLVSDYWPIELYNKIKKQIYNIKGGIA